jgi:hypothetical protein
MEWFEYWKSLGSIKPYENSVDEGDKTVYIWSSHSEMKFDWKKCKEQKNG